ncbi:MAG: hypothetical protein GF307_08990 [candidate division Zixibacteria bacterium]|nr:hypothetical protein [candidate division Zixibacteria bacterium]
MDIALLIIVAVGFYVTLLLTPPIVKFCHNHRILDYPGGRKIHQAPVPRIGGVAMFTAFLVAAIIGLLIYSGVYYQFRTEIFGILLGMIIIFAGGLIDDIYDLKPLYKFLFQSAAAIVTISFGYQVTLLTIPFKGTVSLGVWGAPVTFIWIVGLINAINFLDGMDGLAAGVGLIISATFLISGIILETFLPVIFAAALLGVTAGFLRHNYPPASIFMGDSGAMMIGYLFAVISVIWPKSLATITMIVPFMALGVPLAESAITISRRLLTGKSIYIADTRHIHHLLKSAGLSDKAILWIFYLASMLFSFMVIAILSPNRGLATGLMAIFVLIVFILLLKSARKLF